MKEFDNYDRFDVTQNYLWDSCFYSYNNFNEAYKRYILNRDIMCCSTPERTSSMPLTVLYAIKDNKRIAYWSDIENKFKELEKR